MKRLAPLSAVRPLMHYALSTVYNFRDAGDAPWLTHVGPTGREGKILWVDVGLFNSWAARRGTSRRLPVDHESVVVVEEVTV